MSLLHRVEQALNDWVAMHAPDLCGEDMVVEARARIIRHGGTLAYIAGLAGEIRRVQSKIRSGDAERVRTAAVLLGRATAGPDAELMRIAGLLDALCGERD